VHTCVGEPSNVLSALQIPASPLRYPASHMR
jgi:hypothetical protein